MNELEQFLSEPAETAVDPEYLRVLGKKAANAFLSEQVPLNDSVRSFSKEASLNEQQTRRVIEHANTATFLGVFKGGYENNVSFPLAEYDKIASAGEDVVKVAHVSVGKPAAYVPGEEYVSLDDVFLSEDMSKEASSDGWSAQDMHEYFDVRYRVKQSSSDLEQLANAFEIKVDRMAHAMDSLVKEGHHLMDVVLLVKEAGIDENLMGVLLEKMSAPEKTKALDNQPGLKGGQKTKLPDKVQAAILKKKLLSKKVSMDKAANIDHPLYKEASGLAELTNNILLKRSDLKELVDNANTKRDQDIKLIAEKVL